MKKLSIGIRLIVLSSTFGLGFVALAVAFLFFTNQMLGDQRRAEVVSMVDGAYSQVVALHARAEAGDITMEQAREEAKRLVTDIRYRGNEYFFITDTAGTMVAHPIRPDLIGKNLWDLQDPNGVYLFRELSAAAQTPEKAGFVEYHWPRPGSEEAIHKVSYAVGFEAWDWFVGTGLYTDDLTAELIDAGLDLLGIFLVVMVAGVVVGTLVSRGIARPIKALTASMNQLADGDTDFVVPARDEGQELGAMSESVEYFRVSILEKERLTAEQARQSEERLARQRKIEEAIARFENGSQGILSSVSDAAENMNNSATMLASISEQAVSQSENVSTASSDASQNVQTVAGAAEELTASIGDITQQVTRSATMSREATTKAHSAQQSIQALAKRAEQIAHVVNLISDIAEQTNLLALNATIEAARAGETGKGFAVVAAEVKQLAEQTAKATGQIGEEISAIQGATEQSVSSIQDISAEIEKLDEIASAIAAAVNQQGSATEEIARNVQLAAAGTNDVAEGISQVREASQANNDSSRDVLDASTVLNKSVDSMKDTIAAFLGTIRTA